MNFAGHFNLCQCSAVQLCPFCQTLTVICLLALAAVLIRFFNKKKPIGVICVGAFYFATGLFLMGHALPQVANVRQAVSNLLDALGSSRIPDAGMYLALLMFYLIFLCVPGLLFCSLGIGLLKLSDSARKNAIIVNYMAAPLIIYLLYGSDQPHTDIHFSPFQSGCFFTIAIGLILSAIYLLLPAVKKLFK